MAFPGRESHPEESFTSPGGFPFKDISYLFVATVYCLLTVLASLLLLLRQASQRLAQTGVC